MIIAIIVGLLVCFVVPMFFQDGKRKRKNKKQRIIEATCRIIGIVIIASAIIKDVLL